MLRKLFCPLVVLMLCAGALFAQSTVNPQGRPARRGGQDCLQQAGIDRSVMQQIHSIGQDARSQVESVCSNSSLTPQQKQQQVREIKEHAMHKREGLMTPDQRKALMACQQAKSGHLEGSGPHEGLGGGCAEFSRNGPRPGGSPNRAPNNGTSTPPSSNQ